MKRQIWVGWICAIGVLFLAYWRGEFRELGIAFAIGSVSGLFLDFVGTKRLRYWEYTRYRFFSLKYFVVVVPSWGVLGGLTNLLWNLMGSLQPWLILLILTCAFLLFWEGLNLRTRTWKYYAPGWLVVAGWFPLVFVFRVAFLVFR